MDNAQTVNKMDRQRQRHTHTQTCEQMHGQNMKWMDRQSNAQKMCQQPTDSKLFLQSSIVYQ
jgi:hypothetical protein